MGDPDAAVGAAGDVAVIATDPDGLLVARHAAHADAGAWTTEHLAYATRIRKVVVTPLGVTVVAFTRTGPSGDSAMVVAAQRGQPFGAPVEVTSAAPVPQPLALSVVASGAVVLAHAHGSYFSCCGTIEVAVMHPGGTRFGKARRVYKGSVLHLALAADRSGALMTWTGGPVECNASPKGCARVLRALRLDVTGRAQGRAVRVARDGGRWHDTVGEPGQRALVAWMPNRRVHSCRLSGQPLHCARQALAPAFTDGWAGLTLGPSGIAALSFGAYERGPGAFSTLDRSGHWSALRSLPQPVTYSTFLRDPDGTFLAVDPGSLTPESAPVRVYSIPLQRPPLPLQTLDWRSDDEATGIVAADGNAHVAVVAALKLNPGPGGTFLGLNAAIARNR